MPQHFVCLTFDLDNTSGSIWRGGTTPTMISRGDFGMVGTERLLALTARESIATTWFVPGHTIESYPASCEAVLAGGHEIGHHGWTHRPPASLGSREEEEAELVRGIEAIHGLSGQAPRGYRSPSWDLSEHSIGLLLQHGFAYDSSLMGHDYLPYQARDGDAAPLEAPMTFGPDTPLVEMPISWSLDDYPAFEFSSSRNGVLPGLMNADLVLQNWLADFGYMAREYDWGVLTYTFHPHVIGRGHRMLMLERLIASLRDGGATFVTMERAVAEYRRRYPDGRSERGR
ncbi:polysaccharide deacetylase [Phenylobacterium sp.]|uniref:polysaccharide deacetylase family protein n=1 Tax=Phenylobacterium sp. TaxID=1871053 RepID=UPI002F4086DF